MGDGVVKSLDEVAVVTIGDIVGFQEGIIDMWGEGAKWTPFSKTKNIVVDITPVDGLHPHEHEETVRIAGLTAAESIGESAREATSSESEIYELGTIKEETDKHPNLPKVAYVEMLISQGLLHDGYIYGVNSGQILPTYLHPNEELDHAVISVTVLLLAIKLPLISIKIMPSLKNYINFMEKKLTLSGLSCSLS